MIASTFTESTVEQATLDWLAELGYSIAHGPDIAPGEPAEERATSGDVLLFGRLRAALDRRNTVDSTGESHRSQYGHVAKMRKPTPSSTFSSYR